MNDNNTKYVYTRMEILISWAAPLSHDAPIFCSLKLGLPFNNIQKTEPGLFKEIKSLEHVQLYSGNMYSCDQCDFNASTTMILYKHKRTKHEGTSFSLEESDHDGSQQCHLTHQEKQTQWGDISLW